MNLTVVDHIAEGREVLVRAAKLAGEGTSLALREAQALRDSQAIKSETLMGAIDRIRQHACPACGCWTLLPKAGRAWCVNGHCARGGRQRRWDFREMAFIGPGTPVRVCTTDRMPRDVMDIKRLLAFFAPTGRPMSSSTLRRLTRIYKLPSWPNPLDSRARLYSMSDVATAHAVHSAAKERGDCTSPSQRPPCTGLADLFFTAATSPKERAAAKALCGACPLREACLETALEYGDFAQHGIAGGLTARERQALKSPSRRKAVTS